MEKQLANDFCMPRAVITDLGVHKDRPCIRIRGLISPNQCRIYTDNLPAHVQLKVGQVILIYIRADHGVAEAVSVQIGDQLPDSSNVHGANGFHEEE